MDTINLILGIIASLLSIFSIIFSKKMYDKNKKIEQLLKQELNITLDSSKNDKFSIKKTTSGDNGNSIIGDNNEVGGDR